MVRPGLAFNKPYSAVYFGIKSDSVELVVLNPDIVFKLIYELRCLLRLCVDSLHQRATFSFANVVVRCMRLPTVVSCIT
jgi:hypothetical protein